jgi:hypothetical protein
MDGLRWLAHLLKDLKTKRAMFTFTDRILMLKVLPRSSKEVVTYFFKRNPNNKPYQDVKRIVNVMQRTYYEVAAAKKFLMQLQCTF